MERFWSSMKPIYYVSKILGLAPYSLSKDFEVTFPVVSIIYSILLLFFSVLFNCSILIYDLHHVEFRNNSVSEGAQICMDIVTMSSCLMSIVPTLICWRKNVGILQNIINLWFLTTDPVVVCQKKRFVDVCLLSFGCLSFFIFFFVIWIFSGSSIYVLYYMPITFFAFYNPFLIVVQFSSFVLLSSFYFSDANKRLSACLLEQIASLQGKLSTVTSPENFTSPRRSVSSNKESSIRHRPRKYIRLSGISSSMSARNSATSKKCFYPSRHSAGNNLQLKLQISSLVDFHSDLSDLVQIINSAYSVQILGNIADSFASITICSFCLFLYVFYKPYEYFIELLILVGLVYWSLLKITVLLYAATTCTKEANRTAVLVHKLISKTRDVEVREELRLFSLQLLHRKIQFTACGFFPLDFTLLYSIVGAVTTYLVILIQFQLILPSSHKNDTTAKTTATNTFFTPTEIPEF